MAARHLCMTLDNKASGKRERDADLTRDVSIEVVVVGGVRFGKLRLDSAFAVVEVASRVDLSIACALALIHSLIIWRPPMVMEMEADMDTVLERFDLLLDRDGRGGSSSNPNPCELVELVDPFMSQSQNRGCSSSRLGSVVALRGADISCPMATEEAAAARGPRFCADVAKYSMDAYPLAHHARFSGLAGCLAVCAELLTRRGGREDCVLEFFLPPECRDGAAQKAAAEAVAATIRERFGGGELKAVDVCGLHDLGFEVVADDDECVLRPDDDRAIVMADMTPTELGLDDYHGGGYERDYSDEEDVHQLAAAVASADVEVEAPETNNNGEQKEEEDPKPRAGRRRRKKKKVGKRKNEKTVSLEELQRYFSGRMKDAARSLGVCPTTMKRICRQHGISRWPFRQIAKANNSLDKVKRIFESVQYSPTPPMAAPAASQQAPAPATAHGAPAVLPCRSGAHGVASSQGSCCQEPPPRKSTIMRKPFHASNDGLVTVKASYRGDIVRFRVPSSAGVEAVKGEVAKRLGLDMDAFDVKYLDDDNEWVLLSCDADFQECLEVVPALSAAPSSSASGAAQPVVRLMVQEVADSHGSSCGSSD
ncbi:hypothetical protein PR202_ga06402 [Eleusine coracana subsp. coracana]|uniref:Uncharacterized protein n=1 Tax=Eleusine coracana subsp. coracana TaxID=191504 RepID=A0AAV5BUU9_ELECO|nr:hypothetical protein PR202_ga06402 [Eleusine coracana subsp. coracana]